MSKKKEQPEEQTGPVPYSVNTAYGTMSEVKHTFNGKTYKHMELDSPKLEAIGELLIESDIFSAVKQGPDGLNIDAGMVVSHLIRKRLVRRLFVILLTREDGANCVETDFDGKASEFMKFSQEVFSSFFTLNPDALQSIGMLLIAVLGTAAGGGQLIAMLLAGKNYSGASANSGPKAR